MIPRLTATQFHRFMGSGRTVPALCTCENPEDGRSGDYVVKLRGALEQKETALSCELIASRLATHFGIAIPEPALIEVEADFAELIANAQPQRASQMRNSVGLNFGCKLLNDASLWPVDRRIPDAMWQAAVSIFVFDALIQNPDRRYSNPNLLTRGDAIFVLDHEMSFSFLWAIPSSITPWKLDGQAYLNDHVFYSRLKSRPIDVSEVAVSLAKINGPGLDVILADVPREWKNESLGRIEQHLRGVSAHAEEFVEEIRRRLK